MNVHDAETVELDAKFLALSLSGEAVLVETSSANVWIPIDHIKRYDVLFGTEYKKRGDPITVTVSKRFAYGWELI